MTENASKAIRLRLGPKAMSILERASDITPQAFDAELARVEALAEDRDRAIFNEKKWQESFEAMAEKLEKISVAQATTVDAIDRLNDKVDQRTAQLANMHNHTSGLIGTRLTEGTERKRLLGQFQELYAKIEKQVEQITLLVKEHIRDARAHLDDARRDGLEMVQLAESEMVRAEHLQQSEPVVTKDRGMER